MEWKLLSGLPPEDVRRVLAQARRRRFGRGEILFHEGDPAASLHLIASGRLAVRVTTPLGDIATVEIVTSGGVVGELALVGPTGMRNATVVALEPTESLSLDAATFAAVRDEHPAVAEVLVHLLAARVRHLTDRLVEAWFVPADTRVLRRVLELTDIYGERIPLTQEDVAGLAGTTRSTVNRVLRREEQAGTVELGRGRVKVLDRETLARSAR